VIIFGDLEMTVDVLVEIDKLIQLIESPIFACKYFFFLFSLKIASKISHFSVEAKTRI
jgi:hypothetical protein